MSFMLDNVLIDSIDYALVTDLNDNPLYMLTQISESTIEISGVSKEANDKDGNLIKKFWKGKTGTYTATNAMCNTNIVGAMSGQGVDVASGENKIMMPKISIVNAGGTLEMKDFEQGGFVKVAAMTDNGAMGKVFEMTTAADADHYSITGTKLTPPTADGVTKYIVLYKRKVSNGIAITNRADKFPSTVRVYMKVLYVDPCSVDTLRYGTVYLPSFQVSPEVSITFTTEGTLDYTGDLQVDYCGDEKVLYQMFFDDETEEA